MTLSHSLTPTKLEAYSFESSELDLMRSFFNNYQNRARLGHTESNRYQINRGCPQGSFFGPMLWSLFQNDLLCFITIAKLSMLVNDHRLYTSAVGEALEKDGQLAAYRYHDNYLPQILTNSRQ